MILENALSNCITFGFWARNWNKENQIKFKPHNLNCVRTSVALDRIILNGTQFQKERMWTPVEHWLHFNIPEGENDRNNQLHPPELQSWCYGSHCYGKLKNGNAGTVGCNWLLWTVSVYIIMTVNSVATAMSNIS
jgi:hypothetical protein